MKKNKLYTANRWNQPLLTGRGNLFGIGGVQTSGLGNTTFAGTLPTVGAGLDYNASRALGAAQQQYLSNFASKENAVDNPFSFKDAFSKEGLQNGLKAGAGALVGGLAGTVGQIGGNLISGGLQSGVGSAISGIGSTVGSAVSAVNPLLGSAISLGSGLLGGVTNALFGTKVDEAKLRAANEGTAAYNNFQSNATSFNDVTGPVAQANVQNAYSGGLFTSGSARRKNEELKRQRRDARSFAFRSVDNNVDNLIDDQMNNALANYSAFGGPIEMGDMGAINYGFMSDYLTQKRRENDMKSKMSGFASIPAFMPNSYAIGGDLQTNGGDFSTGMTHINAGLSHEENPNEGVQVGIDNEGTPNLVEEGETIFNDYVFSNRILADEATKQMFRLPKKKDITFADISKRLEKEIAERPNDPISKAGFEKQMQMLEEQQERQKQEMEAERAKAAFEALSPEEQTAVMQRAAQEEQAAQQMAQQQAIAEQQAMQQPSQEEIPMVQQQQIMQADGSEAALGQEPQMNCFGGKINRFDLGGKAYTRMVNSLGFHTQKEFDDWAKKNNIDLSKVWSSDNRTLNNDILSNLWKDENFKKALKEKNPALAHAFSEEGYDWGAYQPSINGKTTIQSISKGNWKATNGRGWRGSEDLAFKQATEGLSDDEIDALTTEQLADRMKKTDAYQKTNKWLQNSDNALQYLNTLIGDPDTPEVAREYARKFVKDGKWKDGFNYDYATVFGSNGKGVRETNPGTYWHTVLEANRGNQADNFVINEDGSVEPIIGNVPTDWTPAGNYTWADEGNDYAYNYYKRPVVTSPTSSSTSTEPETTDEDKKIVPNHRAEWLRYAGLFGPAVGLGMQMADIGRPNTDDIDAAIEGAGDVTPASWKPIGNYLTYRPLDIWYEQNRMNANARATDRNIMNTSGGNRGTAMAGLLANAYNSQIASGNLFRQAQEYNDNLRKQVAEFNRGTDQFNSEQFGATSRFNADARNQARRANAQMKLHAAAQKADMDAGWYNSLYGNVAGLFRGISDLGRENAQRNQVADMAATGIFGNMNPDSFIANGMLRYETDEERKKRLAKNTKCKGGKLKKKGLTF